MKNLKVNKELLKKKVVPFAVATSLFSGGLSYLLIDKSSDPDYVEVSDQVRQSMYYDNPDFQKRYTIDENSSVDENINDESLKYIENLDIDLQVYEDISYLNYCKHIKNLIIRNAQFLKKQDADIINNLHLKELTLSFNTDHIDVEGINNDYDLKKLKCNRINIKSDNFYDSELKRYMLYLWGKNTFGNSDFNFEDKEKYELIDRKINTIIRNKSIRKKDNEADTVISALIGVCDYFKYDDDSYELYVYKNDKGGKKQMIDYNENILSSTLIDNNGKGVCVNVTALLNAVLYKLEIESYEVPCEVMGMGHSISIVNVNDDWKFIDATAFDEYFKNGKLGYDEYTNSKDEEGKEKGYKKIKKNVLINGNEVYEKYMDDYTIIPYIEIDDLIEKDRRIIVDNLINEGLEGQNVEYDHNIIVPVGIGFTSGAAILLFPIIRRREKMNKESNFEEKVEKRKEELKKIREFLSRNKGLLAAIGGVGAADYYSHIMDFSEDLLLVQLSLGSTFVLSSAIVGYYGSSFLSEYLKQKEETAREDLLKKEDKKREKEFEKSMTLQLYNNYVKKEDVLVKVRKYK